MTDFYIVAVENSGDQLGASLIAALRMRTPDVSISGVGGPRMAEHGITSEIDISDLAVVGFVEAFKIYPLVIERVGQVVGDIMDRAPKAVVLIDSWGFMVRVAKALKKAGYTGQIIKYVAPQVWAMREGRAKILARYVDHLLTLHSFDAPYFERHGLSVSYIGNPVFEIDYTQGDAVQLRTDYNIPDTTPIVGVFFGSRLSEIQNLTKPFGDAVARLKANHPEIAFFSPVSDAIATDVNGAAGGDLRLQDVILLPEARKFDVFKACDVALACSGTVTTQLACVGVPTVVAYRLNALTYFVAKHLYKPDYVSIVNIAADAPLMPEFIQEACTGEALASAVEALLFDPSANEKVRKALRSQTKLMAGEGGDGSARAAKAVLSLIA